MNNEKKQTTLEIFIEKLEEVGDLRDCTSIGLIQLNIDKNEYIELKRQAKEIEKEQILEFTRNAVRKILDEDITNPFNLENYYNETYGGNK